MALRGVDLRHLQSLYNLNMITRITFSSNTHMAHNPPAHWSVEPRGAGLLPWASSVSGTAKPSRSSLPCMPTISTMKAHCLCFIQPHCYCEEKKMDKCQVSSVSLLFTAKCAHAQTYTRRDFTPQCTADHGCKLRLSCSWPFDTQQHVVTLILKCTMRAGSAICGSSQNCISWPLAKSLCGKAIVQSLAVVGQHNTSVKLSISSHAGTVCMKVLWEILNI